MGRCVAATLAALGTTVLAVRRGCDVGGGPDGPAKEVHPPSALHSLLSRATAVVIALPLTPETRGMLDASALAILRDGVAVVNVGRAEIIDEVAMWREVDANRLAFASDVWWDETSGLADQQQRDKQFFGSSFPFHSRENVVMTPHYGGGVGLDGIEVSKTFSRSLLIFDQESKVFWLANHRS